MRRLATQTRGDSVQSQRDYQEIVQLGPPIEWSPSGKGQCSSIIRFVVSEKGGPYAAFGGYFTASADVELAVTVRDNTGKVHCKHKFTVERQRHWTRAGWAWALDKVHFEEFEVSVTWQAPTKVMAWGLNCGVLRLPKQVATLLGVDATKISEINPAHLAPEAFYLSHDSALCGGTARLKNAKSVEVKTDNPGKKCSQCQRILPIDPRLAALRANKKNVKRAPQSMVLAFHGHKSKKTGYQNECRACKKFEINDHFNPIRTADQLHESSTLTRERKVLLRESEILKLFKERENKSGLRHAIWKRFKGCCFKCSRRITLRDYELDHTRPLAYLWPLDEHATCLCSECNNRKKDHFPVDFYTATELKRLSTITGLSVRELTERAINAAELARIRHDIVGFAREWSPRLFNSIATRVLEILPDIDLFAELRKANIALFKAVQAELKARPPAVGDEEVD